MHTHIYLKHHYIYIYTRNLHVYFFYHSGHDWILLSLFVCHFFFFFVCYSACFVFPLALDSFRNTYLYFILYTYNTHFLTCTCWFWFDLIAFARVGTRMMMMMLLMLMVAMAMCIFYYWPAVCHRANGPTHHMHTCQMSKYI